jgi:hypothetical protein
MQLRYAILDIERLRPHEKTNADRLAKLVDAIRTDGYLRRPVLVDDEHFVILDGHHRYEALRRLGCVRIPVYLVEYGDDGIGLTTWPEAAVKVVTKAEVLERGIHGDLFPPKTTRHLFPAGNEEKWVRLELLR